jgi:capsular polysaccharide biosynthesis protein
MADKPILFKDYVRILWKYSWVIIVITFLFTVGSAYISFYVMKPTYQAQAEILVNETNEVDEGEGEVEEQLINLDDQFKLIGTYMEILKSPRIMDGVEREIAKTGNREDLEQKVSFENVENTQVIKIIVENESPEKAAYIANTYALYFQEEIYELMKTKNVHILSEAKTNATPVKPKPFINISISFMLGVMISFLIIFLFGKK